MSELSLIALINRIQQVRGQDDVLVWCECEDAKTAIKAMGDAFATPGKPIQSDGTLNHSTCPEHGRYVGTNCTYCDYPPLFSTSQSREYAESAAAPSKMLLTKEQWADEILKDFKAEKNRNKADEWEACYAMLFKQLNELAATKRESGNRCLYCKGTGLIPVGHAECTACDGSGTDAGRNHIEDGAGV